MRTRTDTALLILTALCVAGLAFVAGAVSFAHMRTLAIHHDQLGWQAYAFPISVDGLEIVASLFLVARRRAGRPTGWIPWVALVIGTMASLAANVAVGGADPIGKAMAGWPAVSMLISVKLLFSMIDHTAVHQDATIGDVQQTLGAIVDLSGTVGTTGRDGPASSSSVPGHPTDGQNPSTADASTIPRARVEVGTVTHLLPSARAAHSTLARDGRRLSRHNLAHTMRDGGTAVCNADASLLVKILKAEQA